VCSNRKKRRRRRRKRRRRRRRRLRGASGLGAQKGSLSYTPYGLKGLQIRGSRSPGGS
jgi:hypothetical protein